jgi:uncharacterized YigZ family protein
MDQDLFHTVEHFAVFEQKIKGSRFIGRALPVTDREQAEADLAKIRKDDYDATHHCFAWRVGLGLEGISRFSDDGEPAGTAGRPILQALLALDLTNVLLVVTRYFGGTKLGTGGLSRAYGQTAAAVLQRAGQREVLLTDELQLVLPYDLYGLVQNQVEKCSGKIGKVEYDQNISMQVMVRKSFVDLFKMRIVEQSNGKIRVRLQR